MSGWNLSIASVSAVISKKKKERKRKLDKDDKVKQFEIVSSINLLINYLIKILDKISKHLAVD